MSSRGPTPIVLRTLYRACAEAVAAALRVRAALPGARDAPETPERLGRWQGGLPGGSWVWVHAASVGEARIAAALVHALKERAAGPDSPTFVVTCQTATGCRTAREAGVRNVHYFPIDCPSVLRLILSSGRLLLYVGVETELWPTLLAALGEAAIPAAIANARVSEASFGRYRRVRALFEPGLSSLAAVCSRDRQSAERMVALGARQAVVEVTGDIKFDMLSHGKDEQNPLVGVRAERPLLVAASTHDGEEPATVEAFEILRTARPGLRLALIPRHPERGESVAAACAGRGLQTVRWTSTEKPGPGGAEPQDGDWDVLVVDVIGRLRRALAGAAAAFVGGSLRAGPGGHNLLEVSSAGLRVVTGPYLANVSEQVELLRQADAITIVNNAKELAEAWRAELDDPAASRAAAARALAALEERRGALARTVEVLAPLLAGESRGARPR